MEKLEFVKVYDFNTQEISQMPALELGPGMVKAKVQGVGDVWVDGTKAKSHGYRHDKLLDELVKDIDWFRVILHDVRPLTRDEWIDGFRKDMHPEKEVAVWVQIAMAYDYCTKGRNLPMAKRKEIFKVILQASMGCGEQLFNLVQLKSITEDEATEAAAAYYAAAEQMQGGAL